MQQEWPLWTSGKCGEGEGEEWRERERVRERNGG